MPSQSELPTQSALRIGIRLKNLIFPIDLRKLLRVLEEVGYKPTASLPPVIPGAIERLGGTGTVAARATTAIDVNYDRGSVGVSDQDPKKLVEATRELADLLKRKELAGPSLSIWFFEFQGHFEFFPPFEPSKVVAKATAGLGFLKEWGKILGKPAAIQHIKVVPEDFVLDSPDYFDIMIEPDPLHPQQSCRVLLLYRREERDKVLALAESSPELAFRFLASLA